MPTKQETFDTVVTHLRKQGEKAMDDADESCVYRSSGVKKCAAGCLIPDDLYDPEFEKTVVRYTEQTNKVSVCIAGLGHDLKLVNRLQRIHDQLRVEMWERYFQALAAEFGLTYTPPAESL